MFQNIRSSLWYISIYTGISRNQRHQIIGNTLPDPVDPRGYQHQIRRNMTSKFVQEIRQGLLCTNYKQYLPAILTLFQEKPLSGIFPSTFLCLITGQNT